MNLLFAIDDNVVKQMLTTLYSIKENTEGDFDVYVLQKDKLKETTKIQNFCDKMGMNYHPVIVDGSRFKDAPITDRYPATIYYRLLAHEYFLL